MSSNRPSTEAVVRDRAGHSPRILVVEDNKVTSAMIADYLRSHSYQVDQAYGGVEALLRLEESDYDLILTDIIMPDLDGIELLRKVRVRDTEQEVVIISSSVDINHTIEAVRLRANDYIVKPIDFGELHASVDKAVKRARAGRLGKEHRKVLEMKMFEEGQRADSFFFDAVRSLINAVEARDRYTSGHSLRVTELAEVLARAVGLEEEKALEIRLAAQLHDIGKLGMSDFVLSKPGGLTDEEMEAIRKHPEVGYNILNPILPAGSLDGVRYHHERWDGGGYPQGLAGEGIPLAARIISLADAYDAMTSERVYRPTKNVDEAREEIVACSGTQFDPQLASRFLDIDLGEWS